MIGRNTWKGFHRDYQAVSSDGKGLLQVHSTRLYYKPSTLKFPICLLSAISQKLNLVYVGIRCRDQASHRSRLTPSDSMMVEATGRYPFGNPVHSICFRRKSFQFGLKKVKHNAVYHHAVTTSEGAFPLVQAPEPPNLLHPSTTVSRRIPVRSNMTVVDESRAKNANKPFCVHAQAPLASRDFVIAV